jgi:hypothetical protein
MSDKEVERVKFELERKTRAAERGHDVENEIGVKLGEAAVRDAQEAIRAALLINGGAAIAILAFMGAMASKGGVSLIELRGIAKSLYCFTGGVATAAVTAACAYFTNSAYAEARFARDRTWEHPYLEKTSRSERFFKIGRRFHYAGLALAILSLIAFVVGVILAARAIARMGVG